MPYHPAYNHYSAIGLTVEEERTAALKLREREVVVTEEMLSIERAKAESAKKSAFWNAMQVVAIAGIPIVTFMGWDAWFRKRRK